MPLLRFRRDLDEALAGVGHAEPESRRRRVVGDRAVDESADELKAAEAAVGLRDRGRVVPGIGALTFVDTYRTVPGRLPEHSREYWNSIQK